MGRAEANLPPGSGVCGFGDQRCDAAYGLGSGCLPLRRMGNVALAPCPGIRLTDQPGASRSSLSRGYLMADTCQYQKSSRLHAGYPTRQTARADASGRQWGPESARADADGRCPRVDLRVRTVPRSVPASECLPSGDARHSPAICDSPKRGWHANECIRRR